MPRELVAVAPRTPAFREYADEPLGPDQIRARVQYAAPKHGTELHLYRGDSAFGDAHWEPREKVFLPGAPPPGAYATFPLPLGNMAVGTVSEVGAEVRDVAPGDRVAGYAPLRETQRWTWA